jgi:beta-galactosidase
MIFGADYYPEQWTASDWEEDIKIMKELGLKQVRMAEFAWALMEPKPGRFDFRFFQTMMDLFHKHGMGVILGTPTATFPPWLAKKYPGILQVSREGILRVIGTRRQACFASPEYRKASERIVQAMSKALGKHPALVGWQIDNEPGHEGSDISYSNASAIGFRNWLKQKYKTLDQLNRTWGSVFWGIVYTDWNEIPLPGNHVASGFNPSMIQDFYRFNSDMIVQFVNLQTKILRKNSPGVPITTNLYPSPFLPVTDMRHLFEDIDYVSWDNYPVWGPQSEPYPHQFVASTLQYSRGLKNRSFTVMEQFSGQQGHDTVGYLPPPGQISAWLVQAIAHGADQIFFFRYRTALFGQEQLCYGILDHSKQITHKYKELQKTISEIQDLAEDFASEPYPAKVALIHDIDNSRNYKHQPLSEGLKFSPVPFAKVGYDIEIGTWFSGISALNVNAHLIPSTQKDLHQYKVLVLPLYTMVDPDLVDRLEKFVEEGGTLVLGYRSGIMDKNHWMLPERTPGVFRKLAGVETERFDSIGTGSVKMKFRILPGKALKFCELLEPITAEPIAWYNDKNKFYKGVPVITKNRFGKGTVYYVGASLSPESFVLFYRRVLRSAGIPFRFLGAKVERIFRTGKKFDYQITINHSDRPKWIGISRFKPFEWKISKLSRNSD